MFEGIIERGIRDGEFPVQDVQASAACIVGSLFEGLVGPLALDSLSPCYIRPNDADSWRSFEQEFRLTGNPSVRSRDADEGLATLGPPWPAYQMSVAISGRSAISASRLVLHLAVLMRATRLGSPGRRAATIRSVESIHVRFGATTASIAWPTVNMC
ncbi:hypothetical protein [Bradyrhizobium sp. LTSP885]|uniref:hypothetical protein n=1 Tax=Bradyrhizobium sp. LTSP885 TaxID=1619232 RepID=UPI001FDAB1AB|nr:hypothetical protein [Bradyrhizobium sp. LTSP885]